MIASWRYKNVRVRQLSSTKLNSRRTLTQLLSPSAPSLRLFLTTPLILHHQQGLDFNQSGGDIGRVPKEINQLLHAAAQLLQCIKAADCGGL